VDPYEYIVNISRDFITLINRDYVYEIVNDSYCREMGLPKEEVLNRRVSAVWGQEKFEASIRKHLDDCFEGREIHYLDSFKFGSFVKYMHVSFYPFRRDGRITHALVFSHDITQLGEIESRLSNYEYRDPVTGLFNRRSLNIILEKEIEKAKRSRSEKLRALLFIALENMAKVNQVYGHEIGDLLLENTGLRIRRALRGSDFIFRFEGNQLTAILTNISRSSDAGKVARKIHNAVAVPYDFKGTEILLACSIGIAVYPEDGQERNLLIQRAASALEEAKRQGSGFQLFNAELHREAQERLELESDLAKAFDEKQLQQHFQPVVDVQGRIRGAEALIRWQHPRRGAVPPLGFLPLAEETGLIQAIDRWTLFTACQQLAAWESGEGREPGEGRQPAGQPAGLPEGFYLSVNLSVRSFNDPQLLELLGTAMDKAGLSDPRRLKLEITETRCMENPEATIRRIGELKDKGFETQIDDFGSGYSSLGYLKRLPVETFKVDRMFVEALEESQEERDYLGRIIDTIRSRRKLVVVEGVGTAELFAHLKQMHCDLLQGFYFSRPLPAAAFHKLLRLGAPLP
jgi:diguanylate cyclase (GGDEF)-like protein/PAS domain S-box-containing protein